MRNLVLLLIQFLACSCYGQETPKSIDSLATLIGMEFVYADKIPLVNPFGYYGATAVFGFTMTLKWSGLFLFRREYLPTNQSRKGIRRDLFNDYDYFLVFYWREHDSDELHNYVLPIRNSLNGMSLHYGGTNLNLTKFNYLDGDKEAGPNVIADYSNGSIPIVISGKTGTTVLYFYRGRWLQQTERFE